MSIIVDYRFAIRPSHEAGMSRVSSRIYF